MNPESIDAALQQIRATLRALAPVIEAIDATRLRTSGPGEVVDEDAPETRIAELERQIVVRDEFIATVAHELKNALTPLLFQTRVITTTVAAPPASLATNPDWTLTQARRLERQMHRVVEVLDRLLDASRLSSGRIDLRPDNVNLGEIVRDVIAGFAAELDAARCEIEFHEAPNVTGMWDRMRVEQISRNLLSNAIRYGAGRPIEISVDGDDLFAVLEVRDHGIGIDKDDQQRIFERFESRHADSRSGGFGVGLWIVKNICLAMEGTISVDSDSGKGARFVVVLPRKRLQPADPQVGLDDRSRDSAEA
jgi:signal transduction histidine kinase